MNNNPDYRLLAAEVMKVAAGCYNTFPNNEEKVQVMYQVWATLFAEEQLKRKHIKRGIYWMRRDSSHTMPTPGKFLEWTKIAAPGETKNNTVMPKPLVNKQSHQPADKATAKKNIMNILTELTFND